MAEPHVHSQPIQTYGPAPHNRNIWPHNSQAAVFCLRFWPILLFAFQAPSYPLLIIVEFQLWVRKIIVLFQESDVYFMSTASGVVDVHMGRGPAQVDTCGRGGGQKPAFLVDVMNR